MNGEGRENLLAERAAYDFSRIRGTAAFRAAVRGNWEDPEALEAAILFCQSLGYCRIWGVDLGRRDGSVPAAILPRVCAALTPRIVAATHRLEDYERKMAAALTDEEQELCSTSVLRLRMDAWAAWIAIDERLRMLQRQPVSLDLPNRPLGAIVGELVAAVEQWDANLLARADLLATLAGTHLIENWRSSLAEPYRRLLPWWLDEVFWLAAADPTVPNYLAEGVHTAVPHLPMTPVSRAFSVSKSSTNTHIRIDQPLALAAAAHDPEMVEWEFSSREQGAGARALVQIPRQYTPDNRLLVQVRFLFVARDPAAIRPGSLVQLGPEVGAPALMTFPDGEQAWLRASFSLSATQVQQLQLEQALRLIVDQRIWYSYAEGEPSDATASDRS